MNLRVRDGLHERTLIRGGATMPQITPATTVFVPVSDQDRAADFYVQALGLEKTADFTYADGDRGVEVGPPGATMHMALTAREDAPAGVETGLAFSALDI